LLLMIGGGTVLFAVMMALVQHDLKRLLSYHAVSQVGYMVLGIGAGTAIGLAGSLFHMLNNAIYKSCLFLAAGAVQKQTGTTNLDKLGGLARCMPVTFGACTIAALSISGIPPFNGFSSKWLVYQGLVEAGKNGGFIWVLCLAAAMLGSALTLASFVKVLHATFLCKPSPALARKKIREVAPSMWLPMVVLASLCILFGVFPFTIPLGTFIYPAVGSVVPTGAWLADSATAMMLIAFAIGLIVYRLTTGGRPRTCETYIGGEIMDETYISGEKPGTPAHVTVTGVDFYSTIENMFVLKNIYALARKKVFDVYDVFTNILFYFVEALRTAHSGRLPTYLTWLLAGFLILLWALAAGT
jgi:NADH:ubiquinone oxidoreductase subunit 5 (subunit L)/multisubunit Na+/H+ antiporter MnhA subunit